MLIGAHVSIFNGVFNAPNNAAKIGGEVFQMFTRSPQGGPALELTDSIIKKFKAELKKYKLSEFYIHTPYYINLASSNNRIRYGSIGVIRDDLERGSKLGANYLMTHLGSSTDLGPKKAMEKVVEGIQEILDGYQGTTQFLIEMSAGAGNIIGDTFEEIQTILEATSDMRPTSAKASAGMRATSNAPSIGVCFDTCHAFASGYDLRNTKAIKKTFDQFDKIIGLENLKLIHANDSKADLGSHIDRHEHIGQGKIGLEGFKAICSEPRLRDINLIIEIPRGKDKENINILKRLRDEKYK